MGLALQADDESFEPATAARPRPGRIFTFELTSEEACGDLLPLFDYLLKSRRARGDARWVTGESMK